MTEGSMTERVTFYSEGTPMAGVLHLPVTRSTSPLPAVVCCLGFGLIKEVLMPPYAEALVAMGYAVLRFDYRTFGESGGAPRCRLIPPMQVADIRNALSFLQTRAEVDPARLALFGTSMGASMAVATAGQDARVKAVVAVAGPGDMERVWRASPSFDAFREKVWAARRQFVATGEVTYSDITRLLSSDPATGEVLRAEKERVPEWTMKITFESLADLFEFRPEDYASTISPGASLFIYPTEDVLIARQEVMSQFAKARAPREIVGIQAHHREIYGDGPVMQQVVDCTRDFLARHL